MREDFQRLFMMSEPEILPLNALAARGLVRPERSQFSLLLRHFLERFFNHETASPDGDAKARLVLIAFTVGLPEFVVALYLWPVYHPFPGWPPGPGHHGQPPSYWLQVNHHLFFVAYSFVAMGIAAVFEWDLFFPDLLDVFVFTALPITNRRLFLARVAAIGLLVAGFLFDANVLAPFVLPAAIDPPNLARFLLGHVLAVIGSGLFAAVLILALQGVLLSILGERLFRKLSLLTQGLSITALLMLLLLFPVVSGAVPVMLQSGSFYTLCFPPFWFLGIYQRLMEGPSAMPIYTRLAQNGCLALLLTAVLASAAYPIAYLRRVRQLVEGSGTRATRNWAAPPLRKLLNVTLVRSPVRRAVFHFVSQTLLRVQRYRIYLVLYGGVGLSVVAATILRMSVAHRQLHVEISPEGIRSVL
jgi:MFS family permease